MQLTTRTPLALMLGVLTMAGEASAEKRAYTEISDAAVVTVADATLPEQTAANELAHYLSQIIGKTIEVIREADFDGDRPGIYVGWTQFARLHGATPEKLPVDAFRITGAGGNLMLCGSRPRGTFYAVAQYLEDWYGVRWFTAQGEELVPEHDRLKIPHIDRVFAPAFASRDLMAPYRLGPEGDERLDRWLAFNRVNGTATDMHGASGPSARFGGTYYPQLGLFVHNMIHVFMQPAKYMGEHPGYFALRTDGTRYRNGLCMTDSGLRAQFLVELREMLAKSPGEKLVSISPSDGGAACHCDNCSARTGPWGLMGYVPVPSYLDLVNYLARGIRDDYPDVRLEYLAYGRGEWYAPHPDPTKVCERNVIVRYAPIHKYHWDPIDSPLNQPWLDILEAWKTRADTVRIWEYPFHHGGWPTIFPMSRTPAGDAGLREWVKAAVKDPAVAQAGWCLTLTTETSSDARHYVNINGYGATDTYEAPTLTVVCQTPAGRTVTREIVLAKSDLSFLSDSGMGSYQIQNEHTAAEIRGSAASAGSTSFALVRFDLSDIPGNALITDASLRLQKCGEQDVISDETFAVYAVPRGQLWGPAVTDSISDRSLFTLPAPKALPGFGPAEPLLPQPNTFNILRALRIYKARGVEGMFLETNSPGISSMHCMADMHYWVFARAMWDRTNSPETIVMDFCTNYYRAAGASVFKYLELLEEAYTDDPVKLRVHIGCMAQQTFFTKDFAVEAQALFDQGEALVSSDPVLLARHRRARMDLDLATLFYLNRFTEEYRGQHGNLTGFPFDRRLLADRYAAARTQLMSDFYPDKLAAEQQTVRDLLLRAERMPSRW